MLLKDYICEKCNATNELLLDKEETPICPVCGSTEMTVSLGGKLFNTIVPMHYTSRHSKAGYQHLYVNRPAEKISVQVGGPPKKR
jgi:hypothetical protein